MLNVVLLSVKYLFGCLENDTWGLFSNCQKKLRMLF